MTALPSHIIRLSDLPNRHETRVLLTPTKPECATIAGALGIIALRKLRFDAVLSPVDSKDWELHATLGVTLEQACVASLESVVTRIDEKIIRRFQNDLPALSSAEIEVPEDDDTEALPVRLDLAQVMIEAISLALPAYPRKPDAAIGELVVTEPGVTPLTASGMKPFAGLADLRDALQNKADGKT